MERTVQEKKEKRRKRGGHVTALKALKRCETEKNAVKGKPGNRQAAGKGDGQKQAKEEPKGCSWIIQIHSTNAALPAPGGFFLPPPCRKRPFLLFFMPLHALRRWLAPLFFFIPPPPLGWQSPKVQADPPATKSK